MSGLQNVSAQKKDKTKQKKKQEKTLTGAVQSELPASKTLQTTIPGRFQSLKNYSDTYTHAVRELVHLTIAKCAESVYSNNANELRALELHPRAQLTHREWRGPKVIVEL